jgi:hypothetical protein
VETFIAAGGNVAFFSGNVCWWRVELLNGDTAMACDKNVHAGDEKGGINSDPTLPGPQRTYDMAFDNWYRFRPENGHLPHELIADGRKETNTDEAHLPASSYDKMKSNCVY